MMKHYTFQNIWYYLDIFEPKIKNAITKILIIIISTYKLLIKFVLITIISIQILLFI